MDYILELFDYILVNIKIPKFTTVILTEPGLTPRLSIATIAAPTPCLLHNILMTLMIPIFETLHTNDTSLIHPTVIALDHCVFEGDHLCAHLLLDWDRFRQGEIFV